MTRGRSRRRLRLRRKRKGEDVLDGVEAAGNEVVLQAGCCLVEAVVSASVLVALLSVPAYLLLTRVT